MQKQIDPRTAAGQAHDLVEKLSAHGIKVSKPIKDAMNALTELEAHPPVKPAPLDISDAVRAHDMDAAWELAHRFNSHNMIAQAYSDAVQDAGLDALTAIKADHAKIIEALRLNATRLIDKIESTVKIPTDTTALIRDGRTDDALAVAQFETDAKALKALYDLRDKVCRGIDFGKSKRYETAVWRNPDKIVDYSGWAPSGPAEAFRNGTVKGGELWWPTPTQARERAQELDKDYAAEIAKQVQAMEKAGTYSGFGTPVI